MKAYFGKLSPPVSEYPRDFIPGDAQTFVGFDRGSPDGDCMVKGVYQDGFYHVQSVEYSSAQRCTN